MAEKKCVCVFEAKGAREGKEEGGNRMKHRRERERERFCVRESVCM